MALKAKGLDFPATISPTTTLYPFLLSRKRTHFVLLQPRHTETSPQLVIGRFQAGNPPTLADDHVFDLQKSSSLEGLWEIKASDCGLEDGQTY